MSEKTQTQKNELATEKSDFEWLMSDPRGRRIMFDLLAFCRVFKPSYTGNSETFFNEGMRNVGLKYFLAVNQFCPEQYLAMTQEHNERMRLIEQRKDLQKKGSTNG